MREVGEINSNQKKKKSIKLNYVTFTDWLVTRLILNGSQPLTRDKFSFMLSAASWTNKSHWLYCFKGSVRILCWVATIILNLLRLHFFVRVPFLKVTISRIEVSPDIQRSPIFLWVPHISSNDNPIPTRENLQKEIHKQSILLCNHGSFETSIEG